MTRRLIAGFLTLCMLVSLCPPSAFAVHSSASEMTEPETVVTEPAAETGAPEETAAPDPVPSEPQKEAEPTQPGQTQPEGTLPEDEVYSYRSVSVGQTVTLTAGLAEGGSWTSDNLAAATVTAAEGDTLNALVYGVAAGVTTVTYAADGAEERWVVYVNDPSAQTGETTGETVAAEAPADSEQATAEDQPQGGSVLDKLGDLLTGDADTQAAAKGITAGKTTITVGESVTLIGTPNANSGCSYGSWSVDDASIASVSTGGKLTGKAAGTVTVTHTYCSKSGRHSAYYGSSHTEETETLAITVEAPVLTGIEVTADARTYVNGTTQLTASPVPANAELGTLTWTSSNPAVLTVDANGLVTGVSTGTATVTVTNGTFTQTVSVTVTAVEETEENGAWVYVYTQVTGDTSGLTLNGSGWYTLGRVFVPGLGSASNYSISHNGTSAELSSAIAAARSSLIHEHNTGIDISNVTFSALLVANGANDYVSAGTNAWHLDGTLEVAQLATVVYRYQDESGNTLRQNSAGEVHTVGTTVTKAVSDAPAISGYTCTRVDGSPVTLASKTTYYITYVYSRNVYTVTYTDGVDGEEVFADQVYSNLNEGTATPAFSGTPTRTGYTFTGWSPAVAETVTANVTYTAQWEKSDFTLTVKYVFEDGSKAAEDYTANVTYGTEYSVTSPTVTGYTPDRETVTGTMPAEDRTETVIYRANTDTLYTVEHWLEALDGGYEKQETENKTGTTGETVTASPKTFTGFTFDGSVALTKQSGAVAADGSLVLKLYYTRNSYKVTYHYTGTVPADATALPAEASYKFGASVNVAEDATATGYTFSGWSRNSFTMPAYDVEITGHFTANDYTLTIVYQYTNGSMAADTHTDTLTYGAAYSVASPVIPGYTASILTVSGTMPDNNKEVTVVYSANTNTGYAVHHYQENLDGAGYTLADTDNLTGTTGALTAAAAKDYPGFTAQSFEQETIVGDGTTVVDIYYTRNSYKVTYRYTGTVPAGATALPAEASYKFGADVTVAEDATATGYTFSGWNRSDFTMPANDVEITGSFTAVNYTLTVRYVYADGAEAAEPHTETLTYEAGYSVDSPVIDGYTADKAAVAGTMPANDVEVTVTYTIRSDLSYTVRYYWNGTTESVKDSETESDVTFGTEVALSPKTVAGWTPVSAESKTLTVGTGENVVIFYYYKNVELTANSDTVTYDGSEHTVTGFTTESVVTLPTFEGVTASGSGTNVGTYPVNFSEGAVGTVDTTAKYIVSKVTPGTLTIEKDGTLTVSGTDYTGIYDGASHGEAAAASVIEGTTVSYSTDGGETWSDTVPTVKDVGTVNVTVKAENANYETATASYTLTVTKRQVTLTSESGSKEYDGTALTRPDVTVSGDGFVEGEVTDIRATGSVTYVSDGTVANTIEYTPSAAFKADNYDIAAFVGTLTIFQRTDTITVTTPSNTKVYDGTALVDYSHTYTGTLAAGDMLIVTYSGSAKQTDAGSTANAVDGVRIVRTVDGVEKNVTANYTIGETVIGTLTVTPREIELTAASDSKVFDGTALTNSRYSITKGEFVEGEGLASVTVEGSQTNVGSSDNVITGHALNGNTRSDNYTITYQKGTLTVTASDELTVTGTNYNNTYDGEFHGNPADANITSGTTLSYSTDGGATWSDTVPTVKDAGTVNVTVKAENPNYETAQNTYTLTVTPQEIELTADSDIKVYDGTALTKNSYYISKGSFMEGEGLASVTVEGSQTNVGSSDNTITGYTLTAATLEQNYTITYVKGTLTVTASDVLTVTGTGYEGTYDANTHGQAATASVPGAKIEYSTDGGTTWSTDFPTIKDVGTVTVMVKATKDNYIPALGDNYTLTVTPAEVTVTANNKTKVYGDVDPALTAAVAGVVDGAEIRYDLSRESGEDVGDYAITPTGAENQGNYHVTFVPGTLTIEKNGTLTVTGKDYSGAYDGASHGEAAAASVTEGTTVSYSTDGGETWSDTVPTVKNVGTVNVTVKAENANYETATASYALTVTPREIELTADSDSKVFDGSALTKDGYTITKGSFVEGEGLASVTVEGSRTDVGSGDNTITGHTLTAATLEQNYTVTYQKGTLTVTPAEVTVTADNKTKVYGDVDPALTAAVAGVVDGAEIRYDLSRDPGEDVGDYAITPAGEENQGNYHVTFVPGTLTIEKNGTLTVTGKGYTGTYDGVSHGEAAAASVTEGTTVSYSTDGGETWSDTVPTVKDVGTVNVKVRATNPNYDAAEAAYTLTVTPAEVTVTADNKTKVYGNTDPALTAAVAGVVDGAEIRYDLSRDPGEDVGNYAITPSGDENQGNYHVTFVPGTLTIEKNGTLTVTGKDYSGAYDGASHGEAAAASVTEGTTLSYSTDDGATWSSTVPTVKDVGTVNVTVKAENANYETATASYTLTVTKRQVTLTSESDTKVYDGTPLTRPNVTVFGDGFVDGEVTDIRATGSVLNVSEGTVPNPIEFTPAASYKASNYDITYLEGTLTVTPVTDKVVVTVTGHTDTVPYDGAAHTVTGFDAVANNDLYTADCYAFTGTGAVSGTDAGDYAMGLAADQFRNISGNFTEVVFEAADGSLTVTRRPVTLTSPTDTKVYDRTPLIRSDVTVGGMGFVSGEVTGIRATGSVLNVSEGTVPNPIEFTPAASYKASNYDITYRVGTLSVTPAARATVVVTGNTETVVYDEQPHTVTGFTNDGRSRDITVTLVNPGADSATGTEIGRYPMGLTAADFIASSPNYRQVDVEVVDGYLDIVTVNVNVTVTVRGNRDTVTYDGSEHTVTGYEIVSVTTNVGRTVGMNGITLRLRGTASASGTEPGTYPMGLTAADFDVDTTIYRGVRVVVEDGQLVIEPETVPGTDPTEEIPDESTPLAEPEEIPEEDVPLATPVWALLNLILSLLTVLGSLFLLSGLFGKKEEEATDENGNLILDDNGESVMNRIKKRAGWRIMSLIPAIGSVIAFFLTENMRNPMVLVDRWTLLMVIIAVIQVMVMMLSKKKTEETQEA